MPRGRIADNHLLLPPYLFPLPFDPLPTDRFRSSRIAFQRDSLETRFTEERARIQRASIENRSREKFPEQEGRDVAIFFFLFLLRSRPSDKALSRLRNSQIPGIVRFRPTDIFELRLS